jgi:hypothetical protein
MHGPHVWGRMPLAREIQSFSRGFFSYPATQNTAGTPKLKDDIPPGAEGYGFVSVHGGKFVRDTDVAANHLQLAFQNLAADDQERYISLLSFCCLESSSH